MKKHIISLIAAILAVCSIGMAQQTTDQTVLVAAGSSSGTYKAFLKEIQGVCQGITFQEVESHGAVENLDLLVTNKVSLAFMHSDVISFRGQREDLSAYKTLITLFQEEVHYIAPRTSKRKPVQLTKGGLFSSATYAPQPVVNSVEDLKGLRVGASGGGAITAQVIKLMGNIPYEFVAYADGAAVMTALDTGDIDAAVFVGGAPLPNLEKLGPAYKILPFGNQLLTQLKSVYKPTTVTYTKMQPEGISTVAADALLVGRVYKTPRMVGLLSSVRKAFFEKLGELQETPGIHPKWQQVSPDNKGTWPYMELTSK
jgi:TRAP-type uncharacterized transport system substrate-binding protein